MCACVRGKAHVPHAGRRTRVAPACPPAGRRAVNIHFSYCRVSFFNWLCVCVRTPGGTLVRPSHPPSPAKRKMSAAGTSLDVRLISFSTVAEGSASCPPCLACKRRAGSMTRTLSCDEHHTVRRMPLKEKGNENPTTIWNLIVTIKKSEKKKKNMNLPLSLSLPSFHSVPRLAAFWCHNATSRVGRVGRSVAHSVVWLSRSSGLVGLAV